MADTIQHQQINIRVDPDSYQLSIDDKPKRIDPLIMRLLLHFYNNQGQVVCRQTLSEQVWLSNHTSDEAINRGVSQLRKLLGSKRNTFIKTVPKQGYLFTLPVYVNCTVTNTNTPCNILQHQTQPVEAVAAPTKLQVTPLIENKIDPTPHVPTQLTNRESNQPFKFLWLLSAAIIILLTTVAISWFYPDTSSEEPSLLTKPPAKLMLKLLPITANNQLETTVVKSLYSQLKQQLSINSRFDIGESDNPYLLDIEIELKQDQYFVSLSIENKTFNVSHFTRFEVAEADLINNQKALVDEMHAYTRLMLTYNKHQQRVLKAYQPLSYYEVDQLAKALDTSWYINDQRMNQYNKLKALQQKYPDVAQVNGIMARIFYARITNSNVDVVFEYEQQLQNALKALSVDPANFDGLHAAISHNITFPQYRAKSIDYITTLKSYHLNHPRVWRNQLKLMIHNRMSCSKIHLFVQTIPAGLFKPHRLKVINHILNTCINEQSGKAIYDQLSFLPENKTDIAIINNINLFNIRHDNRWQFDARYPIVFNSLKHNLFYLRYQLMRENIPNALNFLQPVVKNGSRYWQWYAHLSLSLYDSEQTATAAEQEQLLWRNEYLGVLHEESEMYFAAALITQPDNAQRVALYLSSRPSFPINIMNRKESIAKIMLLHHAGETAKAQSFASQLYHQLEQNYQTSPSSFKFWNLGRYHLLAKLYCGQSCQSDVQSTKLYLDKIFSRHHVWWLDDKRFMQIALSPFKQREEVKSYLLKLNEDLERIANSK